MKKWKNPELMILGIENTKEENTGTKDLLHWCSTCKRPYPHWDKDKHKHNGEPAEPGEGPYPPPTPELPGPSLS